MTLHEDHLAELRKSGLSNETIILSGIETVRPDKISTELGVNIPGLLNAYRIPYENGFARFRCFYREGIKGPKYFQRKNTGNRLYIPANIDCTKLKDAGVPIYFTVGEKKALKACQEGLLCVGLSGLWNWKNKNDENLIPDFDLINFKNRAVLIVPDDDWLSQNKNGYKKNLKKAVYRLAGKLKEGGASVWIVNLEGSK